LRLGDRHPGGSLGRHCPGGAAGVLVKGGVHLENLGRLHVMAFDKTGTLTEGRFAVTDVVPVGSISADDLLALAAAVEQQSSHPLAQAVVQAAHTRHLDLPTAAGLENIAGKGVRSQVAGQPVLIGSLRLFEEDGTARRDGTVAQTVAHLTDAGKSVMVVGHNGDVVGVIGMADQPRPMSSRRCSGCWTWASSGWSC
jgi:Cd2+/Zn2+-exporting ATPase